MLEIQPARRISGDITVPGDKSLSHRALILASLGKGTSQITGFLDSADVRATKRNLARLGISFRLENQRLLVSGCSGVLKEPSVILYSGNSGTTCRLLTGLLAAQPFLSVITGDRSLRKRPMARVVEPLKQMGAQIWGRKNNSLLPLAILGTRLHGIQYRMPVASAQVKTALLLAGLFAETPTTVIEPDVSRDHTERLFRWLGIPIVKDGNSITVQFAPVPSFSFSVPGDFSSAAFFLTLGVIHPDARVTIKNVNLNPTRTGLLRILERMGATFHISMRAQEPEPVGDIEVSSAALKNIFIAKEDVPSMIDELPLWAVAATQAKGEFRLTGAAELRLKESDRIRAIVSQLRLMGARIEELPDGFVGEGPTRLHGASLKSFGDHRIAMALSVAALVADSHSLLTGENWVNISFPDFFTTIQKIVET